MYKQITNDVYWIGVKDNTLDVFDIVMETEFGTTYNAYLIKGEEGHALVETVKVSFFEEYISKIESLVKLEDIKYLIVNHTEPDHAGSVELLLEKIPNLTIIGSKVALNYLKEIVNRDFKKIGVGKTDVVSLGNKTLSFIPAPNLHWPDSMYTYLAEDKTLFTCDSFGSHYAFEGVMYSEIKEEQMADYHKALRYYYDAIFSPFKSFVLSAIEKINGMDIDYIATGHGPVHDQDLEKTIETYREWSQPRTKTGKLVVIPYASSYGYTAEMAQIITEGIKNYNSSIEVKLYNVNIKNLSELKPQILSDFEIADAVIFGSSTINKDATPVIWDLAASLNPIVHQGLFAGAFGSYGWSGEGVDFIQNRMGALKFKQIPSLKLKFKPSNEQRDLLLDYGREIGKSITENNVCFEIQDLAIICYTE